MEPDCRTETDENCIDGSRYAHQKTAREKDEREREREGNCRVRRRPPPEDAVLEKAEIGESAGADKNYEATLHAIVEAADIPATRKDHLLALKKEELLREIVDNVGKRGTGAQDLQNVISVAMLSDCLLYTSDAADE